MSIVLVSFLSLGAAACAVWKAFRDAEANANRHRELQREIARLQKTLEKRGLLANEVAHEIKNPITAILCSVETLDLLIGERIEPDHRKSLRYIKEFGENILKTVSDFIDVTRAETGHLRSRPSTIEVVDLIKTSIGLLESSAWKRKLIVNFSTCQDRVFAHMDAKHLKQIVFNVLHNAIKYSKEGGTIEVTVSTAHPDTLVAIVIEDHGVGIPKEKLSQIFDPYARLDENGSESEEGIGLGLTLCRSLLELCGGNVQITSVVNEGTKVVVHVPSIETPEPKLKRRKDDDTPGRQLLQ